MKIGPRFRFAITWALCFLAYGVVGVLYVLLGVEQPWYAVLGQVLFFPVAALPLIFDVCSWGAWGLILWLFQFLLLPGFVAMFLRGRKSRGRQVAG